MRENLFAFRHLTWPAISNVARFERTHSAAKLLIFSFALLLAGSFVTNSLAASPAATETRATSLNVRSQRDLELLQTRVQKAVKKALAATISVRVQRNNDGFAFGSGVIVSEDGYVLTAAHVSGEPNQEVRFFLADGTQAKGTTLGLHKDLDMGLMKITDTGRKWPHLRRARSSNLKVQAVAASRSTKITNSNKY